jgi:hypothetical protein
MVILRDEVKHPSGVFHGVGHIASSLGLCGSEQGDFARQTAKFLFVHDDHPSAEFILSGVEGLRTSLSQWG